MFSQPAALLIKKEKKGKLTGMIAFITAETANPSLSKL